MQGGKQNETNTELIHFHPHTHQFIHVSCSWKVQHTCFILSYIKYRKQNRMQKQGKKMKTDSENKKQANKQKALCTWLNWLTVSYEIHLKLQIAVNRHDRTKKIQDDGCWKTPLKTKTNLFNHHFFFINQLILKSTALPCLWPIEQDKV